MKTETEDRYLPARQVWERYGITDQSLWRWLHDDELNFPRPLYIGRFRYWRVGDLVAWERAKAKAA